jgi:hypothetical protein
MDKAITFLNLTLDWFNSVPGHWYYTAGVVTASIVTAPLFIQWAKKHHLKKHGVEMTDLMVDVTIHLTAALMAVIDFLATNHSNLVLLLPYFGIVYPSIKAFAPTIYNVSKVVHAFAVDRKAKKPLTNINLIDLTPQVQSVTSTTTKSGQPSSSFGTASAGVDVVAAPPQNLFAD